MNNYTKQIYDLTALTVKMARFENKAVKAAKIMSDTIIYGGIIYVIGNGGSAADANHFTGEILGRFKRERKGLGAISLTADNATITAIANDYGYENIFVRQLEGLFDPMKDVLLTMTTSGNSPNIIKAIEYVEFQGGKTVNLLGKDGGIVEDLYSNPMNHLNLIIPSDDTPRIQELHKFLLHYFADEIEGRYVELKEGKPNE
jgi:D-sedoheptulose 7-phosphate isomerase